MLRPYLQMWLGQVIKIINKKSRNELHPKSQTKKSNFWGVFIMKLTYEDKVQIYELRKQGKNRYYSPKLKQEIIDKVLLEGLFSTKCLPGLQPLKSRIA